MVIIINTMKHSCWEHDKSLCCSTNSVSVMEPKGTLLSCQEPVLVILLLLYETCIYLWWIKTCYQQLWMVESPLNDALQWMWWKQSWYDFRYNPPPPTPAFAWGTGENYKNLEFGSWQKCETKKNSVDWIREQTIPTERPPFVGEVSANFFRIEGCHVISATDPLRP
jgi:hypothetical protein